MGHWTGRAGVTACVLLGMAAAGCARPGATSRPALPPQEKQQQLARPRMGGWARPGDDRVLLAVAMPKRAERGKKRQRPPRPPKLVLPEPTPPPPGVGYSGMAELDENVFVVVHDVKANQSGPALGVITYADGRALDYQPVTLVGVGSDVPEGRDDGPNDLEAICPLPGTDDEFLAAESKAIELDGKKKYGRIWHLRLRESYGQWHAAVLHVIQLPPGRDEIEGMAVVPDAVGGNPLLILGERGGDGKPGQLLYGPLDLNQPAIDPAALRPFALTVPSPGGAKWLNPQTKRDCADLLLDEDGTTLWSVAAEDPGDNGPFQSVIYKAAEVKDGVLAAPADPEGVAVPGLKVEALGPGVTVTLRPGPATADCRFTIGTDDESYGGVWRPLLPSPGAPRPATAPATQPAPQPSTTGAL